jgi:hypothetical protein
MEEETGFSIPTDQEKASKIRSLIAYIHQQPNLAPVN